MWEIGRAGSIGQLHLRDDVLPELQAGQVRVAVRAIGLNFADLFALQGLYSATPRGAFTPGLEFAGVIEAVHAETSTDLRAGQRVMGASRFGAYATKLHAEPQYLRPIPDDWDFAEGAALPAQGLTALYALRELGN